MAPPRHEFAGGFDARNLRGTALITRRFLADRILYRDAQGVARFALEGEQPGEVIIDHRFPIEETLEVLARRIEEHLVQDHPGDSLFLIMAPNASRFTEPLLLDRQRRQCVWLSPAALYDTTERGLGFANSARGVGAFVFESHGLALIKNPVSSAARLADLGLETVVQLLRLPLPKPATEVPPLSRRPTAWTSAPGKNGWIATPAPIAEDGSLRLLIDGDRFYPRLQQAIAEATNHV